MKKLLFISIFFLVVNFVFAQAVPKVIQPKAIELPKEVVPAFT
jgi:hypothetical protein